MIILLLSMGWVLLPPLSHHLLQELLDGGEGEGLGVIVIYLHLCDRKGRGGEGSVVVTLVRQELGFVVTGLPQGEMG